MHYIKDNLNYRTNEPTVISLGKFDGLHRGHELLMEHLFARGRRLDCGTMVFTFDMPPRRQVEGEEAKVLTTNEEKRRIFARTGVDYLFVCPFTQEIRCMEPQAFIRWIVEAFQVRAIVVGSDFCFGHNRAGNSSLLAACAGRYGYEAEVVDKVREDGRDISSTYVREELLSGNLKKANRLLGYPFFIQGKVVHGRKLGRTIGIPTVNMELPEEKLLPKNGVYASRVQVGNAVYCGVTNVGCKPTVSDGAHVGVETHIIGFHEDVYGREIVVEFLHFIRPEIRFSSVEELRVQMQRDISEVINITEILQ